MSVEGVRRKNELIKKVAAEQGWKLPEPKPAPVVTPKPQPKVRYRVAAYFENSRVINAEANIPRRMFPGRLSQIAKEVARKHDVQVIDLVAHRRSPALVAARHEYFYRALAETSCSAAQVGRYLNRDHTTVLHAVNRHAQVNNLPLPGGCSKLSGFKEGGRYAKP